MKVSVIVPTIDGREHHLRRCLRQYRRTVGRRAELELIVIRNEASCGHAWAKGAAQATGDYIHFTADDLQPRHGWLGPAVLSVTRGNIPAAYVGDRNDNALTCEAPLGKYGRQPNVLVPFFSREQWEMGGWVIKGHYGTDDWITYLAVTRGMKVELLQRYAFRHWVAQEGRDYSRRLPDVEILVKAMRKQGYVPPAYTSLLAGLREQYGKPKRKAKEKAPEFAKGGVLKKARIYTGGEQILGRGEL